MAPGFAGSAWRKDKFLDIFTQHRASLDPEIYYARGGNSNILREAWKKFMQEIIDKGLVRPGSSKSPVQDYIRQQRTYYKKKAKKIRNKKAFAPIPGMTVGAEAAGNDGGGDAGSGVDVGGVVWQHLRPDLEEKSRWIDILRHGKDCQAPDGQCQFSQHGFSCEHGKVLWEHFCDCANPDCPQHVCEVKRYSIQHYKDCNDERCEVCTLIKQYIPDVDMAVAANEQEQAQRYSNLGHAGSNIQHQDVGAMQQRVQQVEQPEQLARFLPGHHLHQEPRLDYPGDASLGLGQQQQQQQLQELGTGSAAKRQRVEPRNEQPQQSQHPAAAAESENGLN